MRVLHFIWLLRAEGLSEEDAANISRFRELNQDFEVILWDERELTPFIRVNYPWALDTWMLLREAFEEDTSQTWILAKMSDFARYLILHFDHASSISGKDSDRTEWNVYFDTDCFPVRSISDFMEDGMLLGENARRVTVIPSGVTRRRVHYDKMDILISGENFNARTGSKRHQVTNAAIITRPNHAFWEIMARKGMKNWKLPVLKSWGTWALSDTLYAQRDFLRFEIIPFHYLNYSPELEGDVPPWTVAIHKNQIRWKNAALNTPWLA